LNVSFEQKLESSETDENIEMVIPVLYSCYSRDIESKRIVEEGLFLLDKNKKTLKINTLKGDKRPPVLSIFRNFSSPVIWESNLSVDDYLFLFLNDNDYFTRWDAGQFLMRELIKMRIRNEEYYELEDLFLTAIHQSIKDLKIKDPLFLATLLTIPGLSELESMFEKVNPIVVYKESLAFQLSIGIGISQDLRILSENVFEHINKQWPRGKAERKILGIIWSYLALTGDVKVKRKCVDSIKHDSMTLARLALGALKPLDSPETEEASNLFYNLWQDNPVVLDSWFLYEASRPSKNGLDVIEKLISHSKLDWKAPNAIRAVLGGFSKNIELFHSLDGQGYLFMAEKLIEVDKINPITASRMVKVFSKWKTYIEQNKEAMYKAILKINNANISSNTREVLELILK